MTEILLARAFLVLAILSVASYTDTKQRLIFDWTTYPAIGIGLLLNLWQQDLMGIALGALVFGLGYAGYYAGKIGGGDVKMYAGIALLLPWYSGLPFVASVLFFAVLSSMVVVPAYYVTQYARRGIDVELNKKSIERALLLGTGLALYFALATYTHIFSLERALLLAIPLFFGIAFMALETGIRKNFFLASVNVGDLEEDEVVAREFLDEKTGALLSTGVKGVIGESEKEKLRAAGTQTLPVYRNLPPFAPFTLIGALLTFLFPNALLFAVGV